MRLLGALVLADWVNEFKVFGVMAFSFSEFLLGQSKRNANTVVFKVAHVCALVACLALRFAID